MNRTRAAAAAATGGALASPLATPKRARPEVELSSEEDDEISTPKRVRERFVPSLLPPRVRLSCSTTYLRDVLF